jgi:sulfoquinovosyltransferase
MRCTFHSFIFFLTCFTSRSAFDVWDWHTNHFSGFMAIKGILLSKIMSIPLILSYHTHVPVYARTYIHPKWLSAISERLLWLIIGAGHSMADATVVTSPQIQAEFVAHNIPRVHLWDKGIDTKRFHPRHKNSDMRMRMTDGHPNDFLMVFVGRLASEKRCKDLKEVLAQMPGSRLCFVGAGPQEKNLKEHFEGLPVHFTGELHGDELCQTFASADVLSFPSDSETLGFVVMEAMASCIPVVAANGGGVPSMVRQGATGYLVEPGDTQEYVRVLKMLQADPDLRERLGKQGRLDAQTWSWEDSMSRITEVTYQRAQEHYSKRWNVRLWRKVFGTPHAA